LATPRRPRNLPAPRPNPLRDLVTQKNRAIDAARERRRVQDLKNDLPSIIQERVGEQIQKLESRLITEVQELGQRAIEESAAALTDQLSGRIETLEKVSAMQTQTLASLRDTSEAAERKVSAAVDQIEHSLAGIVPGFELEPSTLPPLPPPQPDANPYTGGATAGRTMPDSRSYTGGATAGRAIPVNRPRGVPLRSLAGTVVALDDTFTLGDTMLDKMPPMPNKGRLDFMAVAPAAAGGMHPQFLPEAPSMEIVPAEALDLREAVGKNGFCPNCTSVDVRRSVRKGMFDEFLRLFSIAPFRCRSCRHKFYRF
jgi:hypothetical protein